MFLLSFTNVTGMFRLCDALSGAEEILGSLTREYYQKKLELLNIDLKGIRLQNICPLVFRSVSLHVEK